MSSGQWAAGRKQTTDGRLKPSDFTATIDWGDGSAPTIGTITATQLDDGPGFNVNSSHVYTKPGRRERLVIPIHRNQPLKIGLLRALMKIAEIKESDL